jgi:3D (Asp-Asp-Asp) domain-containing protein
MRIIRLAVILLAALAIMFPLVTFASESPNTDTNINIDFSKISNLLFPAPALADEVKSENTELVSAPVEKTEEEIARDAVLAKWKEKQAQKWSNLPKESFVINASAYTASADECDNDLGITASGLKVQEKRTIACPPEFPFGAKLEIEGQGTFVCEDRGGAIKGNHIDIYVKTKKEAFAFGRQNLNAKVVF